MYPLLSFVSNIAYITGMMFMYYEGLDSIITAFLSNFQHGKLIQNQIVFRNIYFASMSNSINASFNCVDVVNKQLIPIQIMQCVLKKKTHK